MNIIEDFEKLAKQIETMSVNSLNEMISPEIYGEMTEKQKSFIRQAKNSFNLKGKSIDEKMTELQNLMQNVANNNK